LSFGAYPTISLAEARTKRDDVKRLLADGIDPAFQAKQDKATKQAADTNTFSAIAFEFLSKNEREGMAEATLSKKRWLISLAEAEAPNHASGDHRQ
jgi:hypothetical protein